MLLHGCSFTLVLITAQIYLEQRVDPAWRARGQALLSLMNSGVGNLLGYPGDRVVVQRLRAKQHGTSWPRFWGGLAVVVGLVLAYFLIAYHGIGSGLRPCGAPENPVASPPKKLCL